MSKTVTSLQWAGHHWPAVLGIVLACGSLYAHHVYLAYHWTDARRSVAGHDGSLILSALALTVSVTASLLAKRKRRRGRTEGLALSVSIIALTVRLCVMG